MVMEGKTEPARATNLRMDRMRTGRSGHNSELLSKLSHQPAAQQSRLCGSVIALTKDGIHSAASLVLVCYCSRQSVSFRRFLFTEIDVLVRHSPTSNQRLLPRQNIRQMVQLCRLLQILYHNYAVKSLHFASYIHSSYVVQQYMYVQAQLFVCCS